MSKSTSPETNAGDSSPEYDSDEVYFTLGKRTLLGITVEEIETLSVFSERVILEEFTNDFALMPPDERYPGCICVFVPNGKIDITHLDRKHNRRSGTTHIVKPRVPDFEAVFKGISKKTKQKKTTKFVPTSGVGDASNALEEYQMSRQEFMDATNIEKPGYDDPSPDEHFLKVIRSQDHFERLLAKVPSTPDKIKHVAKERIKARERLIGPFRMEQPLWGVNYAKAYDMLGNFESVLADDLIARGVDNTLVSQYYNVK